MSPSSSATGQASRSARVQPHSRKTSTTGLPQQPPQQAAPASASRSAKPPEINTSASVKPNPDVHYTVFIRLPFPRNGFEDPPSVDWNATKDKQLWKLISSASNSKDLNWQVMSERFDVPLPFLLQQAAWLYERHFEGMRAQMKRLGAGASATTSPKPETQLGDGITGGSVGMQRTGSNGMYTIPHRERLLMYEAEPKLLPAINTQRSTQPTGDSLGSPSTPRLNKPGISRNPSTTTVTQSRIQASSPRQSSLRAPRGSSGSQRRPPPPVQNVESSQEDDNEHALCNHGASESESEDEPASLARSKVTRRPPLGKKPSAPGGESDGDAEDDDEESSGDGYLPFAAASKPTKDDPAATLRGSPKRQNATPYAIASSKGKAKQPAPESSESSASSAKPSAPPAKEGQTKQNTRGPLSPKQRAQLEKLSPRYKQSGSEESPSMGSSFSDLDELSVTQSALEEALLSNMQHGSIGMGSRMNSLRDALGRK